MLNENLDTFLLDFSVAAILTIGSRIESINVIFDEEYMGMELGVEGRSLTATCKTSDVLLANHRATLTLGGKTYKVEALQPIMDGQFTQLVLSN